MGLFRQAAALIKSGKQTSGLMRKSRELIERESRAPEAPSRPRIPLTWQEAGIAPAPEDPGARIRQEELESLLARKASVEPGDIRTLFREISRLPDSIEAPARLFTILKDHLRLEKAALLLYDPYRMVFAPWAAGGHDRTTLRKLRIPLGFNRHFNRIADGETVVLSEPVELADFQRFFSAREFSGMDHLSLTPFIHEGRLLAVLLISHNARMASPESRKLLDEVSQQAAPLIFRFREQKLECLKRASLESPEALAERIQSLIRASREKDLPVVLIKISLDKIAAAITARNPYLDEFRLQEDLAGIISTLLYEIGSVQTLGPRHLLILVYDMAEMDSRLLLHHLELTVRSFFWELAEEASLDFHPQVKSVHEEGIAALDALSAFD